MVERLSDAQLREVSHAFDVIDDDGDGVVNAKDMRHVLRRFGYSASELEIQQFIRSACVDIEADDTLDFVEFAMLLSSYAKRMERDNDRLVEENHVLEESKIQSMLDIANMSSKPVPGVARAAERARRRMKLRADRRRFVHQVKDADIMEVFTALDIGNKGYITFEDLMEASKVCGELWSIRDIDNMISSVCEENRSRRIDFNAFRSAVCENSVEWSMPESPSLRIGSTMISPTGNTNFNLFSSVVTARFSSCNIL